jgi:enterochelin esterase-like enzyme
MPTHPPHRDVALTEVDPPSGRGRLFVASDFPCAPLAPRELFAWRPDGVDRDRPLPVLYVQDGQNLFDARRVPFGAAWEIDASLSRLIDAGRIPPIMAVGVACSSDRFLEYAPALILNRAPVPARDAVETAWGGSAQSSAYAELVVHRIKPFVDAAFATLPGAATTFVAGASMGGVAAIELLARHPDVFAGAAALSAHLSLLPVDETETMPEGFADQMAAAVGAFALADLPAAGRHRLWLDRSELDIDRFYGPSHRALIEAMIILGYQLDQDLAVHNFPGVGHNEAAWRDRLDEALAFLLADATSPER